jgi:hypothetical protein
MQIFVEDFNPQVVPDLRMCVAQSTARQYLPKNIDLLMVDGAGADFTSVSRVIAFDANGHLLSIGPDTPPVKNLKLATPNIPRAYGDWKFFGTPGVTVDQCPRMTPGMFIFDKKMYELQTQANRRQWVKDNSTAIMINPNTGGLLQ